VETFQHCCRYGGDTERSRTKSLIAQLKPRFPDIKQSLLHALENHPESDNWTPTPRRYYSVYDGNAGTAADAQKKTTE
ncbi:MAG: hypothetical protein ACOYD9_08890, partial [Pyramidobacter sp.]